MSTNPLKKYDLYLKDILESEPLADVIETIRTRAAESGLMAEDPSESNGYSSTGIDMDPALLESIGESLFKIAIAYFRREEYRNTLQLIDVALPAILASGSTQKHIKLRNLEALSHVHLGETRQTLEIYDMALILARESSETDEEARILFNIGNLLETNGTNECIPYLEHAEKILRQSGNHVGLSFCSNAFARYYRNRGEPEKARGFSHDALEQITDSGDPADRAEFLCNLALSEIDLEEYSSAQSHLEQALKMVDTGKERKFADKLVSLLALIHVREERVQAAEELLNSIQDTIEESSVDARADYWRARYRCFKLNSQMRPALEAFEKAVALNRELSEEKRQQMIDIAIEERELQREKRERELLAETNLQLVKTNTELKKSVERVNALTDLLPVCCSCRRVRDDEGYWKQLREFMVDNSDVQFSECLCAECTGEVSSPPKEVVE